MVCCYVVSGVVILRSVIQCVKMRYVTIQHNAIQCKRREDKKDKTRQEETRKTRRDKKDKTRKTRKTRQDKTRQDKTTDEKH